ncbi:MAG: glycosyltransferase family 4 protein [Sphingomicrobium sp.]
MNSYLVLAGLAVFSLVASAWLTGRARGYALRKQLIDVANLRASHSAPTPRGGGIAIVAATVIALSVGWAAGLVPFAVAAGLIGGGLPVAAIGWLDDHGHVRASGRIVAHFAGAAIVLWAIGPFPLAATIPFWSPDWEVAQAILTLLFLVWLINLFNFMDGIDGIAGSEALVVCLCGIALACIAGVADPPGAAAPSILAAASLGFLLWNWPPAKIFMGDVSSGFLGLSLGALALAAGQLAPQLAAAWVALLGVFIADSTATLIHRLVRGEKVYEAHRSHAYQRLSWRLGGHRPVTLGTIAITLFFCFPVACLIAAGLVQPLLGAGIVLAPLAAGALAVGAGAAGD